MAEALKPREYLVRRLWHRLIVGTRQPRCQRAAAAAEPVPSGEPFAVPIPREFASTAGRSMSVNDCKVYSCYR